ncbi:MAG: hypothetical protein P8X59_02140 [Woeseiaceae bacterium]|jgi:intracellular sulfur oxidation DsrE/DsrF family protein
MKKDEGFSEEQLNAFVDGELDSEEKSRIYNEAELSPELDRRLCQQRKMKELVRHAYEDVPPPRKRAPFRRSSFLSRTLVASILLAVGVTGGLFAHSYLDRQGLDGARSGVNAASLHGDVDNFILHVASGEPEQMRAALQEASHLLESGSAEHPRQVEIVANERGINLLRSDITPFAEEIRALSQRSVVFYACSRTVERLQEGGIEVMLVPEARHGYTALDRVVLRMKDGWNYIKI